MPDYITSDEDLQSLTLRVESYVEGSNSSIEKIIDRFCSRITRDKAQFDYGNHFEELIEDIVRDINDSGEMEQFLKYMSEHERLSPLYEKLLKKYFPSDPEGTYTVAIPGIDDSSISDNTDQVLDPRMSDSAYKKILNTLHHVGLNMEQLPQSFVKIGESDIRNQVLSSLKASFPDNAPSAETLNAAGKTDIILKHLNSNLFVAECKIWKGTSSIIPAIDQLLSYLSWRDSKSALIIFVKTSNFTSILSKITEIVENHKNHKKFVNLENQNRFNFEFSLPQDPKKTIKLAVICFNLYQKKKSQSQ